MLAYHVTKPTLNWIVLQTRGGIGYATALSLAGRGCHIAVHFHQAVQKAEELVLNLEKMGVKSVAFRADLSNYDNVRQLHTDVVNTLGNPDILFNNSGILNGALGPNGNIQDVSVEKFEETWRTNTGTAYLVSDNHKIATNYHWLLIVRQLTQLCLPSMENKKWGRIVFNSRSVWSTVDYC